MIKTLRKFLNPPETSWHVDFITQLAFHMNVNVYAEVGIYEGETFNRIKAQRKYAVDILPIALSHIPNKLQVRKILGTSCELAVELEKFKEELDLLFIDANHDSKAVQEDFMQLEKYMSRHGVVCLHDTFPKDESFTSSKFCGDAYLAIPKLQKSFTNWQFVTLPIHPGLTVATKKDMSPPWIKLENDSTNKD